MVELQLSRSMGRYFAKNKDGYINALVITFLIFGINTPEVGPRKRKVGSGIKEAGVIGISPPSYFALPGAKLLGKSPSPGRFP